MSRPSVFLVCCAITISCGSSNQAHPQKETIGKNGDAIACGTPTWKPFLEAIRAYCQQVPKQDDYETDMCQKELIPGFSRCTIPFFGTEDPTSYIHLPAISNKQPSAFKYIIMGNGIAWIIDFVKKDEKWHVKQVDTEFPE